MRGLGIGDWGLGQSPIPNPQSPHNCIYYTNLDPNINLINSNINKT